MGPGAAAAEFSGTTATALIRSSEAQPGAVISLAIHLLY